MFSTIFNSYFKNEVSVQARWRHAVLGLRGTRGLVGQTQTKPRHPWPAAAGLRVWWIKRSPNRVSFGNFGSIAKALPVGILIVVAHW